MKMNRTPGLVNYNPPPERVRTKEQLEDDLSEYVTIYGHKADPEVIKLFKSQIANAVSGPKYIIK